MLNLDFVMISTRTVKGVIEIYPRFLLKRVEDLMIRGGDFYAVWVERLKLWSTDEQDLIEMVDSMLDYYVNENRGRFSESIRVLHLWDAETNMIDAWHRYCQRQMRDCFHSLDSTLTFSNTATTKKDFASKRLPYPLESCPIPSYESIMSTLYLEPEREKLEWAIGSIVNGDSVNIQKFIVLYGEAGTGKSTVLNIVQQLFDGYYSVFDAKALGSSNNMFALESFRSNPLVAIQHDGDLSRIEDNTRINSLVSHESMSVNEKFKSTYENRFKTFLFMGTNKPVKITDAKSGLIRRLIDVSPSGNKLSKSDYDVAVSRIKFELGGIALHCKEVYERNPGKYNDYVPLSMMGASNDFYNFIFETYPTWEDEDGVTLKTAWEVYKLYCGEANVAFPFSKRIFKEELKNYFRSYEDRCILPDGSRVRNYYSEFRTDKFEVQDISELESAKDNIVFERQPSIFDKVCKDCPAQYTVDVDGRTIPRKNWDDVTTKLSELDSRRLHYVRVPVNHIVIDFDLKDENGNKSYERNLEAASAWPPTYSELSKSGGGIHLHYIYEGDVTKLSRIYEEDIEIKVFTGKQSLRRKLTKCNALAIAIISSGLPLKGDTAMVSKGVLKSERGLRAMLQRNMLKEFHPSTKQSIDFMHKILDDAYSNGLTYDVSDMYNSILQFAMHSTNNADYCIKKVSDMKLKSDEISEWVESESQDIVFFDIECFPNLFVVCWKVKGPDHKCVEMINPKSQDIDRLLKYRLVGFNCRKYDNHLLFAASSVMACSPSQLYKMSQRIIAHEEGCFIGQAYNLSYTDVYDFASAGNKKSLKKLEIEMGIHHQELGLPWDQPVDESLWGKVASYCKNDVIATEAAFDYLQADWIAREILADLAGKSVNDSTNSLTAQIIFDGNKKPQSEFNWRDLSKPVHKLDAETLSFLNDACPVMMEKPHGEAHSLLPYFPGYTYSFGKSMYRGTDVGVGGYVYAEPGVHGLIAVLDVSSMHPHSAIAEAVFGVRYTKSFQDIVEGRVSIKHKAWDEVDGMLNGRLAPYIQKCKTGEMRAKDLANGLKTAINAVYGQTYARYSNPFKDPRNIDNIIAKRGALFMVNLRDEVQQLGFTVAHIKTDSIKIPDATPDIIEFVKQYGRRYGYEFEHEATYERMCLVNDAVYIAKYATKEQCQDLYGYVPEKNEEHPNEWTATGTQFAVPYVFKTLFSHDPIEFEDMCETKSVTSAIYLDMNETNEEDHNRIFVGKVGLFCPIKPGSGGGVLLRETDDPKTGGKKYNSIGGTKGYRWLESEMVKTLGLESEIDRSYYRNMVDKAVEAIETYGDAEWFMSDDPYVKNNISVPPWVDLNDIECTVPFDVR